MTDKLIDAERVALDIEAAAKALAECMDYPWAEMTEMGRVHMRKHAAAVIRAATPQPAPAEWQPIETAPTGAKGYSWIHLAWGQEEDKSTGSGMRWGDKFFATATFYQLGQEQQYAMRVIEVQPTHWMPLPAPPLASEAKEL